MTRPSRPDVGLRPYEDRDLELLQRLLGDPRMMAHLGGPESAEGLRRRHERYLQDDGESLFTIVLGAEGAVGWVGYWETAWEGRDVWECGWHVLPEYQRQGIASTAVVLMLERAARRGPGREMHAFPAVENAASNALCGRLGFECMGEVEVEYPRGRMMRSNDWRLVLATPEAVERA